MKDIYTFYYALILAVSVNFISFNNLSAAGIDPTFNMTVKNIIHNYGTDGQDSVITFELYLQQTNQGQPGVNDFEYCCGQFTFRYNKLIQPPGGNMVVGIVPSGSALPPNLRPPSFQVDSLNGYLKASGNLPQSLANFFISGTFPGTRILTFKVRTDKKTFNPVPLNLSFKLGPAPNTFIAYFLPYPDSVDSEQFPSQFAVALMDTVVNHYTVEDSPVGDITLLSPGYGSTTVKKFIDFSWSGIDSADSYKLEISTDANFSNIVYADSSITDTAQTVSSLGPDILYYWRVSAKNSSGYFLYSADWIFRTDFVQVALNSPTNNASLLSLPVLFKWNKPGSPDSPEPVVFAQNEFDNVIFYKNDGSGESFRLADLKYTDEQNRSVFLQNVFDLAPSLSYKLEVADDQNFNNIIYSDSAIADTFKTVNTLNPNSIYYWRVTPINDSLFTAVSAVWSFDTYNFSLISPANNSTAFNKFINFSWNSLNTANSYKLQISTDLNFNNIVFADSTLTDTSVTVSNLNPNTVYHWKVSAKNDTGYFLSSLVWNFSTSSVSVALSSPVNNASSLNLPVTFSWYNASTGDSPEQSQSEMEDLLSYESKSPEEKAKIVERMRSKESIKPVAENKSLGLGSGTTYKLEVATDQNFSSIVFSDSTIVDSFKTVNSLDTSTVYYWRVTPTNDSIFTASSPTWKFDTYPFSVTLIYPPDNAINIPTTSNFSWQVFNNAVSYNLQVSTDPMLNDLIINDSAITDTFRTVSGLNNSTGYYWRVAAKIFPDNFVYSGIRHFTTSGMAGILPTFNMTVKNIATTNPSSSNRDSILRFEVYLQQTNQGMPGVYDFEYCCGQYTWSYNRAIQGNGDLFFGLYGPGTSLPPQLRPPSFQVDSINGYLKMSGNLPQSLANYFISGTFPGTRILTAQLRTSLSRFPIEPLNLRFKLGASPNTFIAAFLPYPDSVDSQQFPSQFAAALMDTVENVYSVENQFYWLPVELASFNANVDRNNVTLNWMTTSETNNQGFDIERSAAGTTEWTKAGNVQGYGTTTETKSYSFSDRVGTGHYTYRLKQIDFNGSVNYHNLSDEVEVGVPAQYSLSQNYPNPFNPSTKIDYQLKNDGKISLIIYDISGREISKLVNEVQTAGYYTINFNAVNLASGIYFYMIRANDFRVTKKMVIVK